MCSSRARHPTDYLRGLGQVRGPRPHLNEFYYFDKDPQAGTLKGVVKYTLNRLAADTVTIRFYDPDLDEFSGSALTGQDNSAGTHWSDVYTLTGVEFDQNDEPVGPISCVLFADESATDAANNRDGEPKPALQKGSTDLQQGPIDLDIAGTTEATESFPGAFVVLNDDDDDASETEDRDDPGPVVGEDDLRCITIYRNVQEVTAGQLRLEATTGADRIKVWTTAEKAQEVPLPATWMLPGETPPTALWVEGCELSAALRDVGLRLTWLLEDSPRAYDDVNATVYFLQIVEAHDHIVPESSLNTCRLKFSFGQGDVVGTLTVEDVLGATVRQFSLSQSAEVQSVRWDGKDATGEVLTASDVDYTYRLVAEVGGEQRPEWTQVVSGIGLKAWGLLIRVDDPLKDNYASGIDEETITTELVAVDAILDGGPTTRIQQYDVEEDGKGAKIRLWDGPSEWHVFYTSPALSDQLPAIRYDLRMTVDEDGILDEASNPFDCDHEEPGRQGTIEWILRLGPTGTVTVDDRITY